MSVGEVIETRPDGSMQYRFDAAAWFSEQATRVAALRAPALQVDPRWHMSFIRGDCMEPLLMAADIVYIEHGAVPQDGDIVSFIASEEEAAAFTARTGKPCGTRILKFYKVIGPPNGPDRWRVPSFVCNDSSAKFLPHHQIVGVVRAIRPLGGPLLHEGGQLGLNAATAVYLTDYDIWPTTFSGYSGNLGIYGAYYSAPVMDCTVIFTLTVTAYQSVGTGTSICLGWDDAGGTDYTLSTPAYNLSGTAQQFTLQYQFTHSGANSGPRAELVWVNGGATSNEITYGNISAQIEYIRR